MKKNKRKSEREKIEQNNVERINNDVKCFESIRELLKNKDYIKALNELNTFLSNSPNDCFALFLYGKCLMNLNRIKEAKTVFTKLSNSNAKNKYSALIKLAEIEEIEGNYELAEVYYIKAITNSDNYERFAISKLVRMLRKNCNLEKAIEYLNYAHNDDYDLMFMKIKLLYNIDKEKALKEYKNLLYVLNESNKLKEYKFEIQNIEQKLFNETISKQIESIDNTNYAEKLYEEIKLANKTKNYENFIESCNELLSLNTKYNDMVYLNLGIYYLDNYIIDKAQENLERAYNSTNKAIKRVTDYYLGNIYYIKGDFEMAETYYKECLRKYGNCYEATHYKLLSLYLKQNRIDEAEQILQKIENYFLNVNNLLGYNIYHALIHKIKKDNCSIIPTCYLEKQILNYSKDLAIEHIKKNHFKYSEIKTMFNKNINIEKLYKYVKDNLIDENLLYGDLFDVYMIDFKDIGKDKNGRQIDKIKVVVIPNTKDIVTMYPCNEPYYKVNNKQKQLTQKKSRIEMFNSRFSKFQELK